MLIDSQLQFANGTWAPTATGNNISPNVYDTAPLGNLLNTNTGIDVGEGKEIYLLITVKTSCTSGGSATVQFTLRTDSNANLTTSPVDVVLSQQFAYTALTAGTQIKIPLPPASYKEFIGVNCIIGTAALTGGAFEADLVGEGISNDTIYQPGFSVS